MSKFFETIGNFVTWLMKKLPLSFIYIIILNLLCMVSSPITASLFAIGMIPYALFLLLEGAESRKSNESSNSSIGFK